MYAFRIHYTIKNGFRQGIYKYQIENVGRKVYNRIQKCYGFSNLRLSKAQINRIHLTFFLTKPLENLLEAKVHMRQGFVRKRELKMPKTLVNTGVFGIPYSRLSSDIVS